MDSHELEAEIYRALKSALERMYSEYEGHNFYYITLVTSGDALRPYMSAWSVELLAQESESEEDADELKWSCVDSPLCGYADDCFSVVDELFKSRPDIHSLSDSDFESEYSYRINAMERALERIDSDGLFGTGVKRDNVYVNIEVMPPDHTNTQRALRLNPKSALTEWLLEAAE
ncbi:MAG: DUF4303 domain-containing protein [Pseudomonadales bacterium]|nr:DUF4303 domain-containing protein [Pseudomonadales bacterium]